MHMKELQKTCFKKVIIVNVHKSEQLKVTYLFPTQYFDLDIYLERPKSIFLEQGKACDHHIKAVAVCPNEFCVV